MSQHKIKYAWWNSKEQKWYPTSRANTGIGPNDPDWEKIMESSRSQLGKKGWTFYWYDDEENS